MKTEPRQHLSLFHPHPSEAPLPPLRTLPRNGTLLATRHAPGRSPTLVFCPGFASDMTGNKATHLAALAQATGHACLLFDYSGHGESGGSFEHGTIGTWTDDAAFLIEALAPGPLLLVGSSMGGWIATLLARRLPGRLAALVTIAAAPDFTQRLILPRLTEANHATLQREGVLRPEGAPPLTRALLEEARHHLLLDAPIPLDCPVRLLHGQADTDVPWQLSLALADRLTGPDVQTILIKDGDHRLSRPQDLALLESVLRPFLGQNGGQPLAEARIAPADPQRRPGPS